MLEILVNATVRMLLVGAAAWLTLRIVRVRNPHVEILVWRMVLLAGLALPALLSLSLAPSFATSFELPTIVAAGPGGADASGAADRVFLLPVDVPIAIYLGVALLLFGRLVAGLVAHVARQPRGPGDDDARRRAPQRARSQSGDVRHHHSAAGRRPRVACRQTGRRSRHMSARTCVLAMATGRGWRSFTPRSSGSTRSVGGCSAASKRWRKPPATMRSSPRVTTRSPTPRCCSISPVAPTPGGLPCLSQNRMSPSASNVFSPARRPPPRCRASYGGAAFAALIPVAVLAASTTQAAPPAEPAAPAAAPVPTPAPIHVVGVRLIRPADPDNYYPAVAKHERVSGYAIVEVDVDVLGQLVDARVLKVQPTDPQFGFADAALQVARNTTYGNTSQQVGSMKFMVKFELKD